MPLLAQQAPRVPHPRVMARRDGGGVLADDGICALLRYPGAARKR